MTDGRYELDLALEAEGEPVLHGDGGYVPYGPTGRSFYYSRPRMTATGLLRDGDEELAVDGEVWFDRQWGHDVNDPFLKWIWFSIRLDDGTTIMLYRFLDGEPFVDVATVRDADGGTQPLIPGDFTITDAAFWASPDSGATYPVRWQVEVPAAGLVLDVNRAIDDQELDARATTLNVYWEGLCFVSGTRDGQPVAGYAYVEMTNFDL